MPDIIKLFHGGELNNVCTLQAYGLDSNREFYMTRSKGLAWAAAGTFGAVLEVELPKPVFYDAIERGYFEERDYMRCIQFDHGKEVKINQGEGIRIINRNMERIY